MRRLLGPVGGPLVFFLVAALVFAGLGWVTVAALEVERNQRETAAQAQLDSNLRVAVRQLDNRMLYTLAVEDTRPFYHYSSADPLTGSTAAPTPLLGAPLPDWMKLHVQLDPATGWDSPQVLTPDAVGRVALAWPELPLRNNTSDRAGVLTTIRRKHPPAGTWELFAARDRATPPDSLPFAAPLFADPAPPSDGVVPAPPTDSAPKPPPPPGMNPVTGVPPATHPAEATSDLLRQLGREIRQGAAVADNTRDGVPKDAPQQQAVPPQRAVAPGGTVGGRGQSKTADDRGRVDFNNRAQSLQRGVQEAKNASQNFPTYGKGGLQQNQLPLPNGSSDDAKAPGPGNQLGGVPGGAPTLPGPVAPGGPAAGDKDGKDKSPAPNSGLKPEETDKLKALEAGRGARFAEALDQLRVEQLRGTLTDHLAALGRELDSLREFDENRKKLAAQLRIDGIETASPLVAAAMSVAAEALAEVPAARPVLPAEERPVPALAAGNTVPPVGPVNIHLGSLRPYWITAADGTDTLVLVRSAKIDDRTVYQGVILDWVRLEAMLKEEVKYLFPDARLLPVKDPAGVSADRAMTALPVQLDPGPQPAPPPAGWTPLRIGLVLVWVAAFVAFAAVGLSGWSLIDLAERRIRFVSAVTHELRTPLTSLRLYLDLLTSGMIHDEAKRQEYLKTLAVESDRLHRLIDNVLDFARLEKRAKNGDVRPVKVGELIEQLRQTWADRVAADGKELVVVSTLPAETEVATDPVMVHQIVGNLIDNARKYTRDAEDRRIWLWARPDGNRVVFEVEDRGPGVPAGERKAIFKPFRRGACADAKAGGAGLGLALAKQWAEVLGGTVAYRPADSAPGSCFRLELPAK